MAASDGVAIRRMNSRWRTGAAIVGAGVAAVGVAGSTAIATAFVCWVQPARGRALASNAPAAPDNANMTFLGLSLDPSDPWVIFEFSLINILVTSVVPVPIAGPVTAAGALLFGLVAGMALSVVTALIGAYIGLVATRTACRPCFMHLLGRYRKHWVAIDTALAEQGSQIALLIRVAPVAPMVLTNILLGLTSISTWTYLWTCAIGLIPSNLPYAYGAQLGASLASEFPPSDPVMLTMTILGFVASVAIAWKVRMQPSPHSPRAPPC